MCYPDFLTRQRCLKIGYNNQTSFFVDMMTRKLGRATQNNDYILPSVFGYKRPRIEINELRFRLKAETEGIFTSQEHNIKDRQKHRQS